MMLLIHLDEMLACNDVREGLHELVCLPDGQGLWLVVGGGLKQRAVQQKIRDQGTLKA